MSIRGVVGRPLTAAYVDKVAADLRAAGEQLTAGQSSLRADDARWLRSVLASAERNVAVARAGLAAGDPPIFVQLEAARNAPDLVSDKLAVERRVVVRQAPFARPGQPGLTAAERGARLRAMRLEKLRDEQGGEGARGLRMEKLRAEHLRDLRRERARR